MNTTTPFPPLLDKAATVTDGNVQKVEILAVMHELKNQVCTLSLGIAALKYPAESEDERQHYLSGLEAVVGEISQQLQRLDNWLVAAGYKRPSGKPQRTPGH
jgi:hypothetical protein